MQSRTSPPSEVEVISSRRLVDSFLKIDQHVIRHRKMDGGMSQPLPRMVISKQDSIGVLLYHKERNSFVLVQQYRYATRKDNEGWMIEIVAGNIDEGESPSQCAVREVMEETGYNVGLLTSIGQGYSSPGISTEKIFLFYGEVDDDMVDEQGGGLEEEGEDIMVVEWSIGHAREQLNNMRLMDLKTQIALQWFFLNHSAGMSFRNSREDIP